MTPLKHIAAWIGLWFFWFWISRNNHPTLFIDGVATALLLAAFASAVYLNWLVLVPRYWAVRRYVPYWAMLFLAMNVLTVLDVIVIKYAYDVLWVPDPRRFGFWMNYGLEFTGMSVYLVGAAVVIRSIRWLSHGRGK